MSVIVQRASGEEQGDHPVDSVFDFLYCDTARIGSFLSQFDDAGQLEKVIQRDSVSRSGRRGFKFSLGGSGTVAGTGGGANVGFERGPDEQASEASERVYDPIWTNARTFLDFLAERDLIRRDIEGASIGQFVLARGSLEFMNLGLLRAAWQDPTIKRMIEMGAEDDDVSGNRTQRRALQKMQSRKVEGKPPRNHEIALALLNMLPHALQVRLYGDADVWCNLVERFLSVSADDLLLKHGTRLHGEWCILGIMDATPDNVVVNEEPDFDEAKGGLIGVFYEALAPAARLLLGRPNGAFGLTPLLIFREVSGD